MASHYLSLNRGEAGFSRGEFTTGTSSTSTDEIELRTLDGVSLTRQEVILALKAFERYLTSPDLKVAGTLAIPTP